MSEEHDHDVTAELPSEATEKLEEYDVENPMEAVRSIVVGDPATALSLLGGGAVLLSALKSLGKGQLRAIPKAAVAAGLLSYGLRNRGGDEAETFQPTLDEIEAGTDGKDVSDAAHAAAERPDSGQESEIDAAGDVAESAQLGEEGETGSRVEFTDDEEQEGTRTKPEHVGDEEDPRRDTSDAAASDDDSVEIDVSDSAMAEETSEATGPDPEQAQPSQTDATEPEETPEEDASDMKVEPGEEADSATDEDDATEDDEDG